LYPLTIPDGRTDELRHALSSARISNEGAESIL
jgi:hypothetical protein